MAWINPKTDWANGDTLASTDFNRIEGNILELKNGKLDTSIADGRYLKLTGGTLSGDLNVGGNIKITKTATIATSLNVGGTGTINNLVVSGGSMTINKNGFTSTINFAKQTNDGGYIQHYENNNASYLRFVVSDDTSADDYFSFGSTPSNVYKELMRLDTRGALALNGSITTTGIIESKNKITINSGMPYVDFYRNSSTRLGYVGIDSTNNDNIIITADKADIFLQSYGKIICDSPIRMNYIGGSSGGLAFSSGGGADRRLYIGTNTDWNGGQPQGITFGDIWIRP